MSQRPMWYISIIRLLYSGNHQHSAHNAAEVSGSCQENLFYFNTLCQYIPTDNSEARSGQSIEILLSVVCPHWGRKPSKNSTVANPHWGSVSPHWGLASYLNATNPSQFQLLTFFSIDHASTASRVSSHSPHLPCWNALRSYFFSDLDSPIVYFKVGPNEKEFSVHANVLKERIARVCSPLDLPNYVIWIS